MPLNSLDRRSFLAALGCSAAACALPHPVRGLSAANQPDLAHDSDRPEFHFVAPHNWLNDPNGPLWWKGQYHLFYQVTRGVEPSGAKLWGHAVSKDLVHWKHLPIALTPTPGGPDSEGCWTGSAVVFNGVPTFIYTGIQNSSLAQATLRDGNPLRETVLLATAEDDSLLRWKKLAEPVIAAPPAGMVVSGFRDPCPWREADAWYMIVGSGERGRGGCALLYRSQDLRHWEYLHTLAEGTPSEPWAMWECPDFFETGGQHCLLHSSSGKVSWSTGDYDIHEHRFAVKRQGLVDQGAFYAPKGFRAPDGRRILWGWIQETRPDAVFEAAGWAGVMSLPRVLTIGKQGQLEINPAVEVEKLRGPVEKTAVKADAPYRQKLTNLRKELSLPIGSSSDAITLRLLAKGTKAWELTVDVAGKSVHCGDVSFPLPPWSVPHPGLRVFFDGSVIESFIGGVEAVTSRVYGLKPGETELEISVAGKGSVELSQWSIAPISPDRLTT
jgi:beta-fructofuranosidase